MIEPAEAVGEGVGKLRPQDGHPGGWQNTERAVRSEVQDAGGNEQRVDEQSGDGGDSHEQ